MKREVIVPSPWPRRIDWAIALWRLATLIYAADQLAEADARGELSRSPQCPPR